ncbi:hypothetical protein V6N11_067841 [Hibiscus sabdariffa]|uniref:Uncharacterized protein n=1 Tax=Hibiscus sabdariffa TaxID=183260 RepID=A0ABR2SSP6_9ROSI
MVKGGADSDGFWMVGGDSVVGLVDECRWVDGWCMVSGNEDGEEMWLCNGSEVRYKGEGGLRELSEVEEVCVAALAKGTMVADRVHCWGPWGLVRCWSSSPG